MLMPTIAMADGYDKMWNRVEQAEEKDLPKTQMEELEKIVKRAKQHGDYGHLLKAQLMYSGLEVELTPDSAKKAFGLLEETAKQLETKDKVGAAIYWAVLGKLFAENYESFDPNIGYREAHERSKIYFAKALADPALLAKEKAKVLKPAIEEGPDSYIFGDDLLSVVCMMADDDDLMYKWYNEHGPRTAALYTSLQHLENSSISYSRTFENSPYIAKLDSLISLYGDLPECGQVGLARYYAIERCNDLTQNQKIAYMDETLERWKHWPGIAELKNNRTRRTNPEFEVEVQTDLQLVGKTTQVKVTSARNISQLKVTISRLNLEQPQLYSIQTSNQLKKVMECIVPGQQQVLTRNYQPENEFVSLKDTFQLPALEPGNYLLEFSTDKDEIEKEYQLYDVSDVFLLREDLPSMKTRFAVVSATTGHPLPGANVVVYYRISSNNITSQTFACNEEGEVIVSTDHDRQGEAFWAYTANDRFMPALTRSNGRYYQYSQRGEKQVNKVQIFTDRAIYRPGQTVHVSMLAFSTANGWTTSVCADSKLKLSLNDANGKMVESVELTTDEFGSAEADFKLPANGLTGLFTLRVDNPWTRQTLRVEEYKRPTFEVEFDEYKERYEAGETIKLKGHARSYAGVPVQGAKVKYTIRRGLSWWYWWRDRGDGELLSEGEATTADDGSFEVPMKLDLPSSDYYIYTFTAKAEVTDLGGESHEGEISIPLGRKSTSFYCNIPDKSEKVKLKTVTFSRRNAAGAEIDGDVEYTIDNGPKCKVKANQPVDIMASKLPSGKHVLNAVCGTDTLETSFILFSLDDQRPCVETHDWFYKTDDKFPLDPKGDPVAVQIGTSDEDTYVLYNVIADDKVVESGHFVLDNAVKTFRYKYKEEYGTGLLLTYSWVKDGQHYTHTTTIARHEPDKSLKMEWTTFRDKLKPGQKEQWSLRVKRPDGKVVPAQIVATMYDKSLDQLANLAWTLNLGIYQTLPRTIWLGTEASKFWTRGRAPLHLEDERSLEFSRLDDLLDEYTRYFSYVHRYGRFDMVGGAPVRLMKSEAPVAMPMMVTEEAAMVEDNMVMHAKEMVDAEEATAAGTAEEQKPEGQQEQVRENLNETAFFFPRRVTDRQGNVTLVFTLPESITTWQFKALAHDKDMNFGWLSGECVAKKDVMVQPNMPRFMRVGDKGTISARIFNTAEKNVSGTIRMQLIDPETEKVVLEEQQPFSIEKDATTSATFAVSPTDDLPTLLICKIVATGNGFSDGEQHYLPILPSSEWVTNTASITQHSPGTASVDLKKLFPEGSSQKKLTVEYTNNPAWLMVQSLPFVGNPNEKNAISLAAAYYANSIGKFILAQSPQAKSVFEGWKREQGDETSLMSSLEKNQDLKNLVLNDTPWVLDADRESDQKRALANFFDEEQMESRLNTIFDRLQTLQHGDGSFSWWQGMLGSPRMTGEVLEFLTRLNLLVGKQNATERMMRRANDYLDKIVSKEVEEFKQREKDGQPVYISSYHALQWVYLNAISGRQLESDEKDASDYLIKYLSKQIKTQTLYDKALMAIVLWQDGQRDKAREYIQSLNEYSVFTEEMGRYYDTPRAGYSWFSYAIPTQVAAIEAMRFVMPDDTQQAVEEMKRWLLQQKRTQSWDTPINSVNAVFAFLNGNNNVLAQQQPTRLLVDSKPIELPQATAGLGYVKTTANANGSTFTAEKTSSGTSWGAVYAQFMQPTHLVDASAEGMSVVREILKDGKPLQNGQTLQVGDKVKVRITIKVERDYDFVQVSDKRAACMEPVSQLSGYHWGYYIAPRDNATNYYFDQMRKGTHIVESEYFIDREGTYETGTCTVQCAYSPEYTARAASHTLTIGKK